MMMMVDEMHKRYAIDNQWLQNRSQQTMKVDE